MTERRYAEDEVREIFKRATSGAGQETSAPSPATGLTLADIQNIALDVGVDPSEVARAAADLDTRPNRPVRKSLGMPVEVGQTIALPRAVTDQEWEQLVAELRATFHANGKITTHGGLRGWTNGNLHAYIEPAETGWRLRMGTFKSDANSVNAIGAAGAFLLTPLALAGFPDMGALAASIAVGASGVGALITNWVRLPRWANERREQMNYIASRLRSIIGPKPGD
jgi:hypothetical protein